MDTSLFKYGLLQVLLFRRGRAFDGGRIFQLSFFNVVEVKCLIIILDVVENVDSDYSSVIVVSKDFVMNCSITGLDKVIGHLGLNTYKAKIVPSSPTSLLGTCLSLIPSDLLYLTQ